MRLTFLGTGTSFGVPQIGCECAVCRSADPRDRRTRTGAVVEAGGASLLLDTPPELRLQLVAAGISRVDAVLYTHAHADHVNGIDDLRAFSTQRAEPLPLHGPGEALEAIRRNFGYIFDDGVAPLPGTSRPRLSTHALEAGVPVTVAGVAVLPLAFEHGPQRVFGYRMGPLAYLTDVKSVSAAARAALRGLKVLVLNALWWRTHPTHLSIGEAVAVAQDVGAERTWLTHLTHETGHAELVRALPPGVAPAHDGLVVEVEG